MVSAGHMKNSIENFFKAEMKYTKYLVLSFALAGVLFSCKDEKETKHSQDTTTVAKIALPEYNEDSAYQFVKQQVDFGPRVPNTKAHDKCGEFLVSKLQSFGLAVKSQTFEATAYDGKVLKLRNIIASINPESKQRILLSAHWDTRPIADQDTTNTNKPIDGANDGGSGVGILMEVARAITLAKQKPEIGIDIILFDGEDYGAPESFQGKSENTYCLGSQYWAKNKGDYSAYFGILLDMAGAKDAKFAMEGVSMRFAPSIAQMVWTSAKNLGYSHHFISQRSGDIIDDHYYINTIAKIPTIDIIEYNVNGDNYFGDYWHTHNDNMSVIDKKTLKAVGHTLLDVVYNGYKQL